MPLWNRNPVDEAGYKKGNIYRLDVSTLNAGQDEVNKYSLICLAKLRYDNRQLRRLLDRHRPAFYMCQLFDDKEVFFPVLADGHHRMALYFNGVLDDCEVARAVYCGTLKYNQVTNVFGNRKIIGFSEFCTKVAEEYMKLEWSGEIE
jgi:hypothetical protein